MDLSTDYLNKLALLARLELDSDKLQKYKNDLNSLISTFGELELIDTTWIEPISQVTDLKYVVRKDHKEVCEVAEMLIAQAPWKSLDGSLLVKNIL